MDNVSKGVELIRQKAALEMQIMNTRHGGPAGDQARTDEAADALERLSRGT